MKCLHPIKIVNRTKYVSLNERTPYVLYVPCGQCCECQRRLQNEYYFRAYHEFQSTIKNGGYVYFDCLTYRPADVPRVHEFIENIPRHLDFMCFDYTDLRLFFVRLRRKLRNYNIVKHLRYFAASEYGGSSTHRPHIHLLLYVDNAANLDSCTLSKAIADSWPYGRTDGLPYKSRAYVQHNTITADDVTAQRVCKYVSKYVVKDSAYQKVINARIMRIMSFLYDESIADYTNLSFDDYLKCYDGKKLLRRVKNRMNQFHRQSLGFGISALDGVNVDDIIDSNIMTIPDSQKVVMRLSLPMYYRRKLFYNLVDVDGSKIWLPNSRGSQYLEKRRQDLMNRLADDFSLPGVPDTFSIDLSNLVDYVVNYRGRVLADDMPSHNFFKVRSECVFSYVTEIDNFHFRRRFLVDEFLGNKDSGYKSPVGNIFSVDDFICHYVAYDDEFEEWLSKYDDYLHSSAPSKQKLFDDDQRRKQIYKELFPR